MTRLDWIPELFPRSGGLAAAGFYKLLGRPRLDPLTVLVRETAQNSWDARLPGERPVRFGLRGCALSDDERRTLTDRVFIHAENAAGTGLSAGLSRPGLLGLHIFDRGTKGLGGPTQADVVDPEDLYDWVDFVLNIGKQNTAGHTGGTYGFGKTISYIVSSVNAIVIHTRTRVQGRLESRLIACAIGEDFTHADRLCTGRHWWGRRNGEVPEPVRGAEADALAEGLGMPPFHGDDTGTNLLVVAPDLGERSPEQAMRFIAESVTWHLWPKLIEREGRPAPMDIVVAWNDEVIPIPTPEERPPLHGFKQAYLALDGASERDRLLGVRHEVIRCQRPKTEVGDLVMVPLVQRDRATVDDGHDPENADSPKPAAVIEGACHHVALLRSPELVIDYLEGPPPPEGGTEWAGVFRARPEHDGRFAKAEPPTHDSWSPALVTDKRDKTIVNVGLRNIRNALNQHWAPRGPAREATVSSTARVADDLGSLVRSVDGFGRGKPTPQPRGKRPAARRADIEIVAAGPELVDGRPVTRVTARTLPKSGSNGTAITIAASVALDGATGGGSADLDPEMSLLSIEYDGTRHELSGTEAVHVIPGGRPIEFRVDIARGPQTTVLLDLRADAAEDTP